MKLPKLYRHFQLDRSTAKGEERTVELSFSSEAPVERWFGSEVLDHSPSAVRLDRLNSGGALLVDHDVRDHVGTVEQARIDKDRHGRALVRFGRSARAEEIWRDVQDGIRTNVSVGYRVHDMVLESRVNDHDTYRITSWEPLEVSLVAVPADPGVGIGRAAALDGEEYEVNVRSLIMEPEVKKDTPPPAPAPVVDVKMIEDQARTKELERVRSLQTVGDTYKAFGGEELAREVIASGGSVGDLQAKVLERVGKRVTPSGDIGLTQKEARHYSILRVVNALINPTDRRAQEAAAFEFECSAAALKAQNRELRSGAHVTIPQEVLHGAYQRDLLAATSTMGGYTVATNLVGFIDMFRNRMRVMEAGAQMLTGLQGNIAIPSQTGGATAYWVAENSAVTESQPVFGQLTMSPKTLGGFVDMSRRLLIQSTLDVEAFVRRDLATVCALAVDLAALSGPGTGNQPSGILTSTSISTTTAGAAGGAPTWAHMVEMETNIANLNADVASMGYLFNAKTRGKLKTVNKATNLNFIWEPDNTVNGYRALVTNQLRSNLTKSTTTGVLSEALFGNFNDLIIGLWSGLDIMADPYTGATAGTVRIVALQDVDVLMRHAESFSCMKDIATT